MQIKLSENEITVLKAIPNYADEINKHLEKVGRKTYNSNTIYQVINNHFHNSNIIISAKNVIIEYEKWANGEFELAITN